MCCKWGEWEWVESVCEWAGEGGKQQDIAFKMNWSDKKPPLSAVLQQILPYMRKSIVMESEYYFMWPCKENLCDGR